MVSESTHHAARLKNTSGAAGSPDADVRNGSTLHLDATVDRDVLLSSSLLHSRSHPIADPDPPAAQRILPMAARQLHGDPKATWAAADMGLWQRQSEGAAAARRRTHTIRSR
jgi:hypothetical protein